MSSMLTYQGYHASVKYDAEENILIGEVFGITDSLSFHGSSISELQAMFEQCIENYLEQCVQMGREPDREFKGSFNVRLSPELHRKAALQAARENITLNQYVVRSIIQAIREDEESGPKRLIG